MPDTVPIQHAPAMKVGGRRLSVSTKHRPAAPQGETHSSPTESTEPTTSEVPDYPRPAPPTANLNVPDDNVPLHHHHQQHEELPKKERNDKSKVHVQELSARKAEMMRPTRDTFAGKDHAAGIRISQPSKVLGV